MPIYRWLILHPRKIELESRINGNQQQSMGPDLNGRTIRISGYSVG
jgi:hypothetical protein